MSRTFAGFTFLLIAIAVPHASLGAEEPAKPGGATVNQGTLPLTGSNTNVGFTTYISTAGTLQVENGNWSRVSGSSAISPSPAAFGVSTGGSSAAAPTTPIPAGPVFYIIIEGAGQGDGVRRVPCTGKETVLDTVGWLNGFYDASSTKMWIARPSPASHDKSTILTIDWEAISRRGINTTNFTLKPGDRLVIGQDPLATRTNLLAKKTAPIERLTGVVGSTNSTLSGLSSASAADVEELKELVRKGVFTDDESLKRLLQEVIRRHDLDRKKAPSKEAEKSKPGQGEEASNTAGLIAAAEQKPDRGEKRSSTAGEAPPHELAMRPLPDYRLEPPDVIQIEMLKMVPLPPYRAAVFDVLKIRANGLPEQPIDNFYMVQADGKISLGPVYGSVRVAGLTIDQMTTTLNKWLRTWLAEPGVSVELARVTAAQPVTGQYLVGQDGTINLRLYGLVAVSGKTVAEARLAIQKQLAGYLQSPELSVDVAAYNSKVYYVITQGAGLGDNVRRLPITGKETVLDAMSQINGLSQVSSKNIWIARPSASHAEKGKILRVDWDAITGRGATATNYQILPGDRVFIGEDPLMTRTNLLAKKTAPIERIMGIVSLTASVLRDLNGASAADVQVLKELVRKGVLTDDEQMKGILQEVIRCHDPDRETAPSEDAEKRLPGR